MPQPLEFKKHVVGWVGGREGALAKAREMLATTHPLTRAGDASKIEPDSARRHAVEVVLTAAKALSEPRLAEYVDAHVAAALDEYELMEGFKPSGAFLEAAIAAALEGEVLAALDAVLPHMRRAEREKRSVGEVVAEAVCAVPVGDRTASLAFLGITVDDVEGLAAESRGIRGLRAGDVVEVVSQDPWDEPPPLAADEPPPLAADEASGIDPWDVVDDVHQSDLDAMRADWDAPAGVGIAQTSADAALLRDVVIREELNENGSMDVQKATRQRKGDTPAAPLPGETPLATACVAALDVLCRRSSATEEDVGRALGVLRAQMNKFRYRKTAWVPTSAQVSGLYALVDQFQTLFADVRNGIDGARP